jgi:hypothetical protein
MLAVERYSFKRKVPRLALPAMPFFARFVTSTRISRVTSPIKTPFGEVPEPWKNLEKP